MFSTKTIECRHVGKNKLANILVLIMCFVPTLTVADVIKFCKTPNSWLRKGITILDKGCRYKVTFIINYGDTELNCNNATITGEGEYTTAITIDSAGKPLKNVSITNCVIQDYKKFGINVTWNIPDGRKQMPVERIEALSPRKIRISNNTFRNLGKGGVFVNDFVSGTLIENSTFQDIHGEAIYLEHDSSQTTIVNSKFIRNGINPHGDKIAPAIAIDSSQTNVITKNTFVANGIAAIALYRNCSENFKLDENSFYRVSGANRNSITNNEFYREDISIRIASRMSQNLSKKNCGRAPYLKTKNEIFVQDEARNNTITQNKFFGPGQTAIRIEDAPNTIFSNRYEPTLLQNHLVIGSRTRRLSTNHQLKNKTAIQDKGAAPTKISIVRSDLD